MGNRLTSTDYNDWSYDVNNRLVGYDGVNYTYDNNGNLTSKTDATGTTTYTYDSENRLIQVATLTSLINYKYDGLGRRIVKTVNGVVVKYVYDDKDVLFELDENEQIKVRYTRTLAIDELISVDRDTNNDGILDATYYYHRDGLGSVIAMTDTIGTVVQTYVYDAFGNIKSSSGSVQNRYTYTSREWDSEAGLYYYRARFYDANIGRFVSEDPIGFDGGINFYVYVDNNPVNFVDPTGKFSVKDPKNWWAFIDSVIECKNYKKFMYKKEIWTDCNNCCSAIMALPPFKACGEIIPKHECRAACWLAICLRPEWPEC